MGQNNDVRLKELKNKLIRVLEEINGIRPVQFLDFESGYVYNFMGISEFPEDDRVFIHVSGLYDNLPSHAENPLRNSRGTKMLPFEAEGMV